MFSIVISCRPRMMMVQMANAAATAIRGIGLPDASDRAPTRATMIALGAAKALNVDRVLRRTLLMRVALDMAGAPSWRSVSDGVAENPGGALWRRGHTTAPVSSAVLGVHCQVNQPQGWLSS